MTKTTHTTRHNIEVDAPEAEEQHPPASATSTYTARAIEQLRGSLESLDLARRELARGHTLSANPNATLGSLATEAAAIRFAIAGLEAQ